MRGFVDLWPQVRYGFWGSIIGGQLYGVFKLFEGSDKMFVPVLIIGLCIWLEGLFAGIGWGMAAEGKRLAKERREQF